MMISINPNHQETAAVDSLQLLANAPLSSSVEMRINVKAISETCGDKLRSLKNLLHTELSKNPDHKWAISTQRETMEMLEKWLGSISDMTVSLTAGDKAVDISLRSHKIPTAPVQALIPLRTTRLETFIRPGSVRYSMTGEALNRMTHIGVRSYLGLIKPNRWQPQIDNLLRKVSEAKVSDEAGSMTLLEGGGIASEAITRGNAGELLQAWRELIYFLDKHDIPLTVSKQVPEAKLRWQGKVRSLAGWPIYSFQERLSSTAETQTAEAKLTGDLVHRFWGKQIQYTFEIAQVGEYCIRTRGSARMDDIIMNLLKGEGREPPLAATDTLAKGGSSYFDLDVSQLVSAIRSLLPKSSNEPLKVIPTLPAIIAGEFQTPSESWYEISIPNGVFQVLGSLISKPPVTHRQPNVLQ